MLHDHVLEVMAISGSSPGAKSFIPRITLISNSGTLPFTMRRKQFPIKPAFAMTANKAQGQTLAKVGIYLGRDFFSHGQLYVALSRCGDRQGIKILKRQAKNLVQTFSFLLIIFSRTFPYLCNKLSYYSGYIKSLSLHTYLVVSGCSICFYPPCPTGFNYQVVKIGNRTKPILCVKRMSS